MSFKNKIQDRFSSLSDKQIYWLFAGILIIIFILDFLVLMSPQLGALSKINPKIKTLQNDILQAENNITRMAYYMGEVSRLDGEMKDLNNKILHRTEVPRILEKISLLANANKVKIDQVMPDSVNQQILLSNEERKYYVLPILIEAHSTYHDFGRFVNDMENEDLYLSLYGFNLASRGAGKKHLLAATVHAVVYEEAVQWEN